LDLNPNHDPKNGQFTFREAGSEIGTDAVESITRPGHLYRGMSAAEYSATVGKAGGVSSDLRNSLKGEGTNFSDHAADAESYANFGRDDPRKTGVANYLVEVKAGADITKKRDGYFHSLTPLPADRVTRVFKMAPQDGAIVASRIK
jgi:hypothetical protein